jgi:hypothetical protein
MRLGYSPGNCEARHSSRGQPSRGSQCHETAAHKNNEVTTTITEDWLRKCEGARVSEIWEKALKVFQEGMNLAIFMRHDERRHGSPTRFPGSYEETRVATEKSESIQLMVRRR